MPWLLPGRKRKARDRAKARYMNGFNNKNSTLYNSKKWRDYSISYRKKNRRCAACGRLRADYRDLACDHIIPIEQGGDVWDERNHQPLCKLSCHMAKSGRESHGKTGHWKLNDKGNKIPK